MKYSVIFSTSLILFTTSLLAQYGSADEARAEIIFDSFNPDSDTIINAGILITLEKDWHIYWRNSGDSGIPTSFNFDVPEEIKITEVQWPIPKIFEFEGYASYGYENKVVFPFQIKIPFDKTLNSLEVAVEIKSLICKDLCKPFNTEVRKILDLKSAYNPPIEIKELFIKALNQLPEKNEVVNVDAIGYSDKILIKINSQRLNTAKIKSAHFIPYENGIFRNSLNQEFTKNSDSIVLNVEYGQFRTKTPESIEGILIFEIRSEEGIKKISYEINEKLEVSNNQK